MAFFQFAQMGQEISKQWGKTARSLKAAVEDADRPTSCLAVLCSLYEMLGTIDRTLQHIANRQSFQAPRDNPSNGMLKAKKAAVRAVKLPDAPVSDPPEELDSNVLLRPVRTLNLGVRGRKMCNRKGLETIEDLCKLTADEIMESPNCGVTTINEIRAKLFGHGLYLLGEAPATGATHG